MTLASEVKVKIHTSVSIACDALIYICYAVVHISIEEDIPNIICKMIHKVNVNREQFDRS